MMNNRQRIIAALKHQQPDRTPYNLSGSSHLPLTLSLVILIRLPGKIHARLTSVCKLIVLRDAGLTMPELD